MEDTEIDKMKEMTKMKEIEETKKKEKVKWKCTCFGTKFIDHFDASVQNLKEKCIYLDQTKKTFAKLITENAEIKKKIIELCRFPPEKLNIAYERKGSIYIPIEAHILRKKFEIKVFENKDIVNNIKSEAAKIREIWEEEIDETKFRLTYMRKSFTDSHNSNNLFDFDEWLSKKDEDSTEFLLNEL